MSSEACRYRPWPALALGLALVACAPQSEQGGLVSLPRLQLWGTPEESATPAPAEAQRRVASSVWGVTRPARAWSGWFQSLPVQGSAVPVAGDQLLAACDVAQNKELVGVARRSSVLQAQVRGLGDGRVCVLSLPEAEVDAVHAYRPFADLQVGEPLVGVASQTSRRYVVSRGRLVAKGSSADPYLETTLTAPPGSRSVAVFDAFGNLVGLGAPDAMPGSLLVAFPVPTEAAAQLTAARIGGSPEVQRSLGPVPQPTAQPVPVAVSP